MWKGPPTDAIGQPALKYPLVTRVENAAVVVEGITAFAEGFSLTLLVAARRAAVSEADWRATVDQWATLGPYGTDEEAGPSFQVSEPFESDEYSTQFASDADRYDSTHRLWVTPVPQGDVMLRVSWPAMALHAEWTLDGGEIARAAERAEPLWR